MLYVLFWELGAASEFLSPATQLQKRPCIALFMNSDLKVPEVIKGNTVLFLSQCKGACYRE